MFSRSHLEIWGGNFTQNMYQQMHAGFDILRDAAVPTAFYDSGHQFDAPRCYENTRVAVLDKIQDWADFKIDKAFIMWLYGAAGAGKSAIARTIAEILHGRKKLLATFFFSRGDPSRNHIKSIVATLAYNIAVCVPESRPLIELVFDGDPHILKRNLAHQLIYLILDPLRKLSSQGITFPSLIVIDGLDECLMADEQSALLLAISNTMTGYDLPVKFLIASRPEVAISTFFDSGFAAEHTIRHSLEDSPQSNADVRHFLLAKFDEVKRTHRLRAHLPVDWPTQEAINTLLYRSSGLFIYPATIVKYVCSSSHHPVDRLNVILGLHPRNGDLPFAQLDALYKHIVLSQANVPLCLKLIGLCLISRKSFHYADIGVHYIQSFRYSGMTPSLAEEILLLRPGTAQLLLLDMNSLMEFSGDDEPFKVLHASLSEFFSDPSRSGELYLDISSLYTEVAFYACRRIDAIGPLNQSNITADDAGELIETFSHSLIYSPPTPALASNLYHLSLGHLLNVSGPRLCGRVPQFLRVVRSSKFQNSNISYQRHLDIYLKSVKAALQQYKSMNLQSLFAAAGCSIIHSQRGCSFCDASGLQGASFPLALYALLGFSHTERDYDEQHLSFGYNFLGIASEVHPLLLDYASGTYTDAAIRCLRFLRSGGGSMKYNSNDFSDRLTTRVKHARPWLWRMRQRGRPFGGTIRRRYKTMMYAYIIDADGSLSAFRFHWKESESIHAFRMGLHLVPSLLRMADQTPTLRLLAKDFVFAATSTLFPQSTRRARKAISRYLCHPQPPNGAGVVPTNMMEE